MYTTYRLTITNLLLFVSVSLWTNNGPNPVPLLLIVALQFNIRSTVHSSGLVITPILCVACIGNKAKENFE
jgi:hypothetical protein